VSRAKKRRKAAMRRKQIHRTRMFIRQLGRSVFGRTVLEAAINTWAFHETQRVMAQAKGTP
jgi:hypothetical protein